MTIPINKNIDGFDGRDGFDGSYPCPRRTVVDEVRDHFERYVVPADESDLDVLALWAVHTHLARECYTTPRLILTSPMPGSGKTTVLEHLERIVPNPVQMSAVSSAAIIPRLVAAEDAVLLIDEAEKSLSPNKAGIEDILGVLNSGYKVGGSRPVLVPDSSGSWEARKLSTFAPVAMAGNSPNLPDDTMQRALIVTMYPAVEDQIEETDWEVIEASVEQLGIRVGEWAEGIRDELRATRPAVPPGCTGRAKERWLPLARVAAFAGGDWPRRVNVMIERNLREMQEDREAGLTEAAPHLQLLRDIHDLYAGGDQFIPTADMLDALIDRHPDRWSAASPFGRDLTAQRLGRMLTKNFTIRSGKDGQDRRGYYWNQFVRAWKAMGLEAYDGRPTPYGNEPSKPSWPSNPSKDEMDAAYRAAVGDAR